jgi:hypothetical protein
MDTALTILKYVAYVLAGAVVTLNAIAPLTKTKTDDKAASAMTWLHDVIANFLVPKASAKTVTDKAAADTQKAS